VHLKGNLKKVGFTQSEVNPLIFISKNVIRPVYVDDVFFFSANETDIDFVIGKLRK